jgi:hypothetical protein
MCLNKAMSSPEELITEYDDLAKRALERTKRNGGITINLDGDVPEKGFAVALTNKAESIPLAEATDDDIERFIERNIDTLTTNEDVYVGAWIENGNLVLDVSVVVDDEHDARILGAHNNQEAFFDLNDFEEEKV